MFITTKTSGTILRTRTWIAVDISIGRVIAMVTVSFPQEQIGVSVDIQADRFFSVREVGARVHVDDRRFQSRHVPERICYVSNAIATKPLDR